MRIAQAKNKPNEADLDRKNPLFLNLPINKTSQICRHCELSSEETEMQCKEDRKSLIYD